VKFKIYLILAFGGWLLTGSGWAQESMTLRQCVEYGLKHHGLMSISDNEIAIADQRVREGLAGYLPQVNGSVNFDDNIKRQTTVIPAGTFSPQEIRIQFGNQYNTNAMVQLDQVIYDRSMLNGLKALRPYAEVSELNKEKNGQSIMYGAAMSYYQILIYSEQEKLLKENEEKFSKLISVLQLQVDKGVARKMDLDRVQVAFANVHAQREVMESEILMAENRLKYAIGMPLDEPMHISTTAIDEMMEIETPQSVAKGSGRVLDLLILDKNREMQEIDLKRKQSMYLPTLTAYGRMGALAFNNDFGKAFNTWFGYASVGLRLNIPIWNSFRTPAQVKQAELTLLSLNENIKLTKASVELQQSNAETQWRNATNNLEVNRANMALAKQVLDVTELQMNKGVATLSDLLTADYAYKEAQTNYITSRLRAITARLEFEKAQGTLEKYLLQ
jgi:outer membrane protein